MTKKNTLRYPHLFFDLDHTLWDYKKNSEETLMDIFTQNPFIFEACKGEIAVFLRSFAQVNKLLWGKHHERKIGKKEIREQRFGLIFKEIGAIYVPGADLQISDYYLYHCPRKTHLFPSTLETLAYLKEKEYQIHLITNGFIDAQTVKLEASGLAPYFLSMTTSDCTGYPKPSPKIFQLALQRAKADTSTCLMIGDNLQADIGGARDFGMDTVLFDPDSSILSLKRKRKKYTYGICHLSELKHIL